MGGNKNLTRSLPIPATVDNAMGQSLCGVDTLCVKLATELWMGGINNDKQHGSRLEEE